MNDDIGLKHMLGGRFPQLRRQPGRLVAAGLESAGEGQNIRGFAAQSLLLGPDQPLLVIEQNADFLKFFYDSRDVTPPQGRPPRATCTRSRTSANLRVTRS